jgi:hypothetical protein
MLDMGLLAEVASAESAVLEWFMLIPRLLPVLQPMRALCFLQVSQSLFFGLTKWHDSSFGFGFTKCHASLAESAVVEVNSCLFPCF